MKKKLLLAAMLFVMTITSCVPYNTGNDASDTDTLTSSALTEIDTSETEKGTSSATTTTAVTATSVTESTTVSETTTSAATTAEPEKQTTPFSLSDIPPFSNTPYCEVNNNKPFFTDDEITTQSYEYYPDLDSLGRCGACIACISLDMMPTTEREGIGMVKPSGWHLDKYDFVDGKYLFNRCHLIGYQLTGENAKLSNLITGTRYMNIQGMLPFENKTAG